MSEKIFWISVVVTLVWLGAVWLIVNILSKTGPDTKPRPDDVGWEWGDGLSPEEEAELNEAALAYKSQREAFNNEMFESQEDAEAMYDKEVRAYASDEEYAAAMEMQERACRPESGRVEYARNGYHGRGDE
jgi:hypothetical protein